MGVRFHGFTASVPPGGRVTYRLEDEPLREAIRNALQRLALLPTAETVEESDAILTDVKRRLTRALNGEPVHA